MCLLNHPCTSVNVPEDSIRLLFATGASGGSEELSRHAGSQVCRGCHDARPGGSYHRGTAPAVPDWAPRRRDTESHACTQARKKARTTAKAANRCGVVGFSLV